MFSFLRQRKIAKDVASGLVFGWRGGGESSVSWLVAIISIILLIAALFSFVSIDHRSRAQVLNHSSQVTLLPMQHPLYKKAERVSPFALQPNTIDQESSFERVRELFHKELDRVEEPAALWRDLPKVEVKPTLPTVYQRGSLFIVESKWEMKKPSTPSLKQVSAYLRGDSLLAPRIRDASLNYTQNLSPEWYGVDLRWIIGLDTKGGVEHCMLLDRMSGEDSRQIEQWLRRLRFHAGERELGQIIVRLEAEL